jgi:hypothetical protein
MQFLLLCARKISRIEVMFSIYFGFIGHQFYGLESILIILIATVAKNTIDTTIATLWSFFLSIRMLILP